MVRRLTPLIGKGLTGARLPSRQRGIVDPAFIVFVYLTIFSVSGAIALWTEVKKTEEREARLLRCESAVNYSEGAPTDGPNKGLLIDANDRIRFYDLMDASFALAGAEVQGSDNILQFVDGTYLRDQRLERDAELALSLMEAGGRLWKTSEKLDERKWGAKLFAAGCKLGNYRKKIDIAANSFMNELSSDGGPMQPFPKSVSEFKAMKALINRAHADINLIGWTANGGRDEAWSGGYSLTWLDFRNNEGESVTLYRACSKETQEHPIIGPVCYTTYYDPSREQWQEWVHDSKVNNFEDKDWQAYASMEDAALNSGDFVGTVATDFPIGRWDAADGFTYRWGDWIYKNGEKATVYHAESRSTGAVWVTYWDAEQDRFTAWEILREGEVTYPLNDTGVDWCANANTNGMECPVSGYPGQDAESGRDVTHNDPSDGHAGFSFTKLDASGNPLAIQNGTWSDSGSEAAGTRWSCVRDNVTGLVWEVKTDDGGLHDKDDRYNWYNTDPSTNGGFEGYADDDGAICDGYDRTDPASYCNTQAYVSRVNAQGLCGARDWRLPSRQELLSIVSNDRYGPAIDADYFPNTVSSRFWSSSPYAGSSGDAWYVRFNDGGVVNYDKGVDGYIRLARAAQ